MCIYIYIRIYLESGLIIPLSRRALDSEIPPVCSNFAQDLASLRRRIVERSSNFRPIFAREGGEGAVKSAERRNTTPQKYSRIVVNFIIMKLCASSCLCERDIESKHRERFYMVLGRSLRSHNRGGKLFDCRLKLHSPPEGTSYGYNYILYLLLRALFVT